MKITLKPLASKLYFIYISVFRSFRVMICFHINLFLCGFPGSESIKILCWSLIFKFLLKSYTFISVDLLDLKIWCAVPNHKTLNHHHKNTNVTRSFLQVVLNTDLLLVLNFKHIVLGNDSHDGRPNKGFEILDTTMRHDKVVVNYTRS